jgi:hypothetical protein
MTAEASRPLQPRSRRLANNRAPLLRCGVVTLTLFAIAAFVSLSPAAAGTAGIITGAGSTASGGFVELNARLLAPVSGLTAPAAGSFRSSGTGFGDLTGTVTCVGMLNPTTAAVSGVLDEPVTSGSFTYPNFVVTLELDSPIADALILVSIGGGIPPDCGVPLFFMSPPWYLVAEPLATGHFTIQLQ